MHYYGLFVNIEGTWVRLFPEQSYTEETAKKRWWMELINVPGTKLRKLPPVKLIDARGPDKKYLKSEY